MSKNITSTLFCFQAVTAMVGTRGGVSKFHLLIGERAHTKWEAIERGHIWRLAAIVYMKSNNEIPR